MEMIAYDDNYTGPALDSEEGERLAKVLGNKTVLFMANHGITTVGQSVADAYDRLYYIERAAQVQLYAMWTGQRLKQLARSPRCRAPIWSHGHASPRRAAAQS